VKSKPRFYKCPLCEAIVSYEKICATIKKAEIQKILKTMAVYLDEFLFAFNQKQFREPPLVPCATVILKRKVGAPNLGKTKILRCIITGKSRLASSQYLARKPSIIVNHYICREALKLLRRGMTVSETRLQLNCKLKMPPVSDDVLKWAIIINGKH